MSDSGVYGPTCERCHRQLSEHAASLHEPKATATEARFPGVNVRGLYCLSTTDVDVLAHCTCAADPNDCGSWITDGCPVHDITTEEP